MSLYLQLISHFKTGITFIEAAYACEIYFDNPFRAMKVMGN